MSTLKIYICRHGETEWSLSGQHTSYTDIPLTENGILQAKALKKRLNNVKFSHVFVSPLKRAQTTAEITGHLQDASIDKDLLEWNYGDYEGKTTAMIRQSVKNWNVFTHGAPNGESVEDIKNRCNRMIAKVAKCEGNIAIFSSGHISRALCMRWVELDVKEGMHFPLSTASLCILGFDRGIKVIDLWNDVSHISH